MKHHLMLRDCGEWSEKCSASVKLTDLALHVAFSYHFQSLFHSQIYLNFTTTSFGCWLIVVVV